MGHLLPQNFRLSLAEQVRGLEGLPSYIIRRRKIEESFERLAILRARLEGVPPGEGAWLERRLLDELYALNLLIATHNAYYPIEANLPLDVRSGCMMENGRPWQPMYYVTVDDLRRRKASP